MILIVFIFIQLVAQCIHFQKIVNVSAVLTVIAVLFIAVLPVIQSPVLIRKAVSGNAGYS